MVTNDVRITHFPYCLKRRGGGYLILNRRYKPLGSTSLAHVDYDTVATVPLEITPDLAQRLSWKGNPDTETIYLYGDACVPTSSPAAMAAYLERLGILMRLSVPTADIMERISDLRRSVEPAAVAALQSN